MCGILAIWNRSGAPVDLDALQRGARAMRHRGPDDEGYVLIDSRDGRAVACGGGDTRPDASLPNIASLDRAAAARFDLALAHRRLAIVDPSRAAHQPMSSDDGATWITYNGMIYNHAEIRARLEGRGHRFRSRSDTEVVLRAYIEWGPGCVAEFNGMWAFAIWDGRARRLFASRDRLGIKPLVLHVGDGVAAFASELKGLTAFGGVPARIDAQAIHHYLSLMQVPAPFTIYERVRKLLPGRSLAVEADSVAEAAHWTLDPGAPFEGAAADELDALLRDSVRLRLGGDAPVGTLLSGGIDSGVVTALAAALAAPAAIPTYTLAAGDAGSEEAAHAAELSAHVASDHHRVPLDGDPRDYLPRLTGLFDEPFAVSSALGVHRLAREASKRVKVLLTGDGGDELFAGYLNRYERADALWDRISSGAADDARADALGQRVRWSGRAEDAEPPSDGAGRDTCFCARKLTLNEAEKRELYTSEWRERTRGWSTIDWLRSRLTPPRPDRLVRWQMLDIATSLPDEMLAKVDQASMACGVEARIPLLDHRVVELAMRLPARLKIAGGKGKWTLKTVAERHLPRHVVHRPKRGFDVPVSDWLRAWREPVRDVLSASALRRSGVLGRDGVESVLTHHESNPGFASSHMVLTILCLQMWLDSHRTDLG